MSTKSKALEAALNSWYTSLSNRAGWGTLTTADVKAKAAMFLNDTDRAQFYAQVGNEEPSPELVVAANGVTVHIKQGAGLFDRDGRGHWEYNGMAIGGLWFDGKDLIDYDGVYTLPAQVATILRNQGFTVEA